ncbi:MAG: ABC transporter substrate-binding protein [Gammaproteobacteria bacterium]|nr:ABC transporter substrate-binding protein [Gammaproteobacteria bacterium]
MPNFPAGKGNPYSGYATPSITFFSAIFDGFTNLQSDGSFKPALAIRWEQLDELTWVFDLRDGVEFSNGEPFNAQAVVRAAEYLQSEAAQLYAIQRELAVLQHVIALDSHRVQITTRRPVPLLPRVLSAFRIVAPDYWDEAGPEKFATAPVGTGPFAVESWNEASIRLVRNNGSWRPAKLEQLDILQVSDSSVRLQTLTSGDVDIAMALSPEDRDLLESSGYVFKVNRAPNILVLTFVTVEEGPLQDPRVRQALNIAINRTPIIDVFLDGAVPVPSQPAIRSAFGYNPELVPLDYDPDRAKKLLAEAGYPDGFEIVAEVITGVTTNDAAVFQQVFADLKRVGVTVNPQIISSAQLVSGIGSGHWRGRMFMLDYNLLPALDALSVMTIHSCLRRIPWHCDEDVMPLAERAYAEPDLAKREQLTQTMMAELVASPPALILYEAARFDAHASEITEYRAGFGIIEYEGIERAHRE